MARFAAPLRFTLPAFLLSLSSLATAAIDSGDMDEDAASATEDTSEGAAEEDATEPTAEATATPADEGAAAKEPWDPNALQFEVGARARMLVIPKFLINAFQVQGGQDIVVGGIGAEGGLTKGNLEALLGVWYAGYKAGPMPFKGPTDGEEAWEIIQSNLGMLYITADLLFRGEIAPKWHWFFGGGAGIGIVTGNLQRQEAYWTNGRSPQFPGDPYNDLAYCQPPGGVPDFSQCPPPPPTGDGKYDFSLGQTSEAWPVYPWLTMQTGVRYQPHQHFITRLDLGIGSSGFWLGLGFDYGL